MRRLARPLVMACLLAVTAGCRVSSRTAGVAEAGAAYADALVMLIDESQEVRVDANSIRIAGLHDPGVRRSDDDMSEPEARRATLERSAPGAGGRRVAKHRRAGGGAGRYFEVLAELAASDAPERFSASVAGTAKALQDASRALGNEPRFEADDELSALIARIPVKVTRHVTIRAELAARGPSIMLQLQLQQAALERLASDLQRDLRIIRQDQFDRRVTTPFVEGNVYASGRALDRWIDDRRELTLQEQARAALAAAQRALGNLRATWARLSGGSALADEDFHALLGDVEKLIALVERLAVETE